MSDADKSKTPQPRSDSTIEESSSDQAARVEAARKALRAEDTQSSMPELETDAGGQFLVEELAPGSMVDRYRVLRRLGGGGMGTVYLAEDTELHRQVALKVPHFSVNESSDVVERFYREARAMARLSHPNLCPVFDVGRSGQLYFITMGLVQGRCLADLLENDEPLPIDRAVHLVRRLALALQEAHRAGVVHRDLKLSNIMINDRDEPIVIDFGLARRPRESEPELTHAGSIVGTPAYMPPEQAKGDLTAIGPSSDVYSLGVILYRLITGRLPFDGSAIEVLAQLLDNPPLPPSSVNPEIPPSLDQVCAEALAKNPSDRIPSMEQMAKRLQLPGIAAPAPPPLMGASRRTVAPRRTYDVYVSYAPSDNEVDQEEGEGWVTRWLRDMQWRLCQLQGSLEEISFAIAHDPLHEEAAAGPKRYEHAAFVILIVSQAYRETVWNHADLQRFREHVAQRNADSLVVVEVDRLDREPVHQWGDAALHRFWTESGTGAPGVMGPRRPDGEPNRQYYARLDDLARFLHRRLRHQVEAVELTPTIRQTSGPAATLDDDRVTVLLAEVTDDLDPLREEIRRSLDQIGCRVLPDRWYPREPAEFCRALDADLAQSELFIQLVGPFAGKRFPGEELSYSAMQYRQAAHRGITMLQWRDRSCDPLDCRDFSHRSLMTTPGIRAVDLEDFKRECVQHAEALVDRRQGSGADESRGADEAFVFVNVEPSDLDSAGSFLEYLDHSGLAYAVPMREGQPEEIRRDLEDNLLDCDGLVIVYGNIPEHWVREQLRQWRKLLHRRRKPLRALAVYDGPPEDKPQLGMKLPRMKIIDCRKGLQKSTIDAFVRALGRE